MTTLPSRRGRLIVKIGSGCLTVSDAAKTGERRPRVEVDRNTLFRLAADCSALLPPPGHQDGSHLEIVIVSSGAVALGVEALGLDARPTELADVQAMAAVGQSLLMSLWREAFGRYGRQVGQVLLTHSDLADRTRYLNIRSTLENLLARGVVPIINENDTVMTDEITVGDNDRLATQVAKLLGASQLLLLSTVPGLLGLDGQPIPTVGPDDRPEDFLMEGKSAMGRGGMGSKLAAARAANHGGIEVFIASGRDRGVISAAVHGRPVGTRFIADKEPLSGRKHWIAYTLRPHGQLILDAGATDAVERTGASILPVGIARITGTFGAGEVVSVIADDGREIARGLVKLGSDDLRVLIGQPGPPAVHRDDLVLLRTAEESAA